MIIEIFKTEVLDQNSYLVYDGKTREGFIVDTPQQPEDLIGVCLGLAIKYIFLTHNHFDHIWGAQNLKIAKGAKIVIGMVDAKGINDPAENFSRAFGGELEKVSVDIQVLGGEKFKIGNIGVEIIATPGHTAGGISLLTADKSDKALFTGDTLFRDGVGRTDLFGGSAKDLKSSLEILEKIIQENPGLNILPGHGEAFRSPSLACPEQRRGNGRGGGG